MAMVITHNTENNAESIKARHRYSGERRTGRAVGGLGKVYSKAEEFWSSLSEGFGKRRE